MRTRLLGLVAVAAGLPAVLPAGAQAVTICVNRPITAGCTVQPEEATLGATLQAAIADARGAPGDDDDQLYLGAGTYSRPGGFAYNNSTGALFIDGAGPGSTILAPGTATAATTFDGGTSPSTGRVVLRGMTVETTGTGTGIDVASNSSRIENVRIVGIGAGTPNGLVLSGAASVIEASSIVDVDDGIQLGGADQFVIDSTVEARSLGILKTSGNATVRRSTVRVAGTSNIQAVWNTGGQLTVENSLLTVAGDSNRQVLTVSCGATTAARFVTLAGEILVSSCNTPGETASLSVSDSVLAPGTVPRTFAAGGTATIQLATSRWDGAGNTTSGGTVTAGVGMRTEDPALGADFRLLPSSPLIDALSPVASPVGEVFVNGDRTGAARITDGDGDGIATPDPGAFELPAGQAPTDPPPAGTPGPVPTATPAPVPTATPVPVPMATPTPVAPYRGVTLRGGRLRLDSKGRLALRATCARTARTRCRGTLTLSRTVRRGTRRVTTSYGRATVSVLPGRTQTVRVTVPRKRRSSIRTRGLALVAKAVTTDASSATKRTTTAKVTALPRKR